MATYKVIQDIEAEDKLLGPLTLRQFIYAAIVAILGFVCFKLLVVSPLLVVPFLPPMIFFGMLAAPFGHDQSSEVWLLAKVRFFLKPRRRIWDQTGLQELVTITVPKKIEKHLTDGLSQTEVKSRLRALANTIDSRGWAVKNVNVNMYSQSSYLSDGAGSSDRLVTTNSLPQEVPTYEVYAQDDILDETSNHTAQSLDAMINQSEQAHRQNVMATIQRPAQAAANGGNNWFAPPASNPLPAAVSEADLKLLEEIKRDRAMPNPNLNHMRVIQPVGVPVATPQQPATTPSIDPPTTQPQSVIPPTSNPEIIRLATNDDLNVATIAREANKAVHLPAEEVTISLR